MALTIQQYPFNGTTGVHLLLGSEYPEFFTCTSTLAATKSDFKYIYKTYAMNKSTQATELISNVKNFPRIDNQLGVYNPIPTVKSLVSTTFQPTITTWTTCSDSIRQFMTDVYEYYDGTFQTASKKLFAKHTLIKNNVENFDYAPYILNSSSKKCLTERISPVKVRLNDYATLRFLNANPSRYTGSNYTSQPYSWRICFTLTDGTKVDGELQIGANPYWYTSIPLNPSTSVWILDSHIKLIATRLLEIGVGPKNLYNTVIKLQWVNGVSINATTTGGLYMSMVPIEYYEIYSYTWPLGEVSKRYRYDLLCPERYDYQNAIQIQWENLQGGIDQYLFTKVNTKTNTVAGTTMLKNKYIQGHNSGSNSLNYIGANTYDRGIQQIYNEQVTTYTMYSDWVTDQQMLDLESLWQSNAIFANIGGTFYPVVSLSDKQIIHGTSPTLKRYQFDIQLSNIRYNS